LPLSPRVYLDYNASAPLRRGAREAMVAWLDSGAGNPSSVHAEGRRGRAALEQARREIARYIGGDAGELVWTGSATEANNLALKGAATGPAAQERSKIFTTAASHLSALEPARWLDGSLPGTHAHVLPVDAHGRVCRDALAAAVDGETLLVSVIAANNETGVLETLEDLADMAHAAGAWLHVDASQCLGRVEVDVAAWGADLVTLSAHKVGGPRGVGALWLRPGVRIAPVIHGGHQERNRRGGTENVLAAVGFAEAVRESVDELGREKPRQRQLVEALWSTIERDIPGAARIPGETPTLCNTLLTAYLGAEGETLLMGLDIEGIAASSGSACTAGSLEPSHVLLAMGVEPELAASTLRFSVGPATTDEDIDRVAAILPRVVDRARRGQ
jgi:cysteine desulfurase